MSVMDGLSVLVAFLLSWPPSFPGIGGVGVGCDIDHVGVCTETK